MDRRALSLLILLAALWGSSYLFIKIALADLSPAMIVATRTALAALVLLPLALHRDAFRGVRPLFGLAIVLAAVQVAAPFLMISYGEQHISSSLTGILVASAPVWTAMIAPFVDRSERSGGTALAGIVIGLLGVGMILGVDPGDAAGAVGGGLMVLGACVGYAVGGFMVKRSFAAVDPIGMVAVTMGLSALLSLPLALATAPAQVPPAGTVGAIVVLGVGGTAIAFVIFYWLIATLGPARASVVAYVAPGFAVLYGVSLYGEPLTVWTLAGLVLIVAGSWLAGRRRPARRAVARRTAPSEAGAAA